MGISIEATLIDFTVYTHSCAARHGHNELTRTELRACFELLNRREEMAGAHGNGTGTTCELLDSFETLGFTQVPPMLDMAALRAAFKTQALLHHPDRNPALPKAACTAKMQVINDAYAFLEAKVKAAPNMEFIPPMGQAGASDPGSRKPFRLKRKLIAFTLSGIMDGELDLLEFVKQLETAANSMSRGGSPVQVVQIAVGYEVHKNAARLKFNRHYHGAMELSHATDCDSSKFDPVGVSGAKLRMNIDKIDSPDHWHNKIRYLCKEGNCYMRLTEGPRLEAASRKRNSEDDWYTVLMEAAVDALTPEHAVEEVRKEFGQVWVLQYDKLLAAAVSTRTRA